ncbi:MAG TPA: FtsQ-type POTRA domain-containing protein [Porticoccaceae bacterium]|jgi:cell division protein FtsQ|nr:FtsQ-type POTRA domain-containing protein [Gammaproteobacteria bacterium]HIL59129.1 FtsQ-type POTRA domain-containing protein [Porticoccaceae bacterium]
MKAEKRIFDTGKGIHESRKRSVGSNNQPLKPSRFAYKLPFIFVILGMGVVVQQNYQDIAYFMNRPITKVIIENQWQHIQEAEVREILTAYMGIGFFDFNVQGVKDELEAHSWVAKASVKKVWPDNLSLNVNEEIAIARWGEKSLLNQQGNTFSPDNAGELRSLPKLVGPEDSQFGVMEQYQNLSQILFPAGLRLTQLSLTTRGSWDLILNESIQVSAGRLNVNNKVERFVDFYSAQATSVSEQFERVDLRYSNGIAVRSTEQDLSGVAAR